MTLICDTGPLYAMLNRRDANHARCREALENHPGRLVIPGPVLAEVCWLLESRIGPDPEAAFLESVAAGEFDLNDLTAADVARMAELIRRYRDFPLGAVDAAVVAVAERLGTVQIATLDHRHFRAVIPAHAEAFALVP